MSTYSLSDVHHINVAICVSDSCVAHPLMIALEIDRSPRVRFKKLKKE